MFNNNDSVEDPVKFVERNLEELTHKVGASFDHATDLERVYLAMASTQLHEAYQKVVSESDLTEESRATSQRSYKP